MFRKEQAYVYVPIGTGPCFIYLNAVWQTADKYQ